MWNAVELTKSQFKNTIKTYCWQSLLGNQTDEWLRMKHKAEKHHKKIWVSQPGSKILPVTVDDNGNVAYDTIVRQNENRWWVVSATPSAPQSWERVGRWWVAVRCGWWVWCEVMLVNVSLLSIHFSIHHSLTTSQDLK